MTNINIEQEINKLIADSKAVQSIALEKQKTNFQQQLGELFTTTLPIAATITFVAFLFFNFILITSYTFLFYLYLFIFTFLITFTIGSFLSFWQEEIGIIRIAINIGKLYNLYTIYKLKQRLEECVDSGIVDEQQFINTLNKLADDFYLFNKPIPANLNSIYIDFLLTHNLIEQFDNSFEFTPKSKSELMKQLVLILQN